MTMTDDKILTWLSVLAGVVFVTFGMTASCGCTVDLNHNFDDIGIGVGVEGECLQCIPICTTGSFDRHKCVQADDGSPCTECRTACVGGRTLMCEEDGPHCYQLVGDGEIDVPVVCVLEEE